jgi:hypothetical protein
MLIGMWEKGEAISLYRGVKGETSFRQIERDTGRKQESLKKWHDLYVAYCKERWGLGRQRAYALMDAAKVTDNVLKIGQTSPATESVARELTGIRDEEGGLDWGI